MPYLKRIFQLFITKDSKKSNAKGQEKISTLKNNSESKGRIQLTEPNSNQLIKRHLGKVEVFWEGHTILKKSPS